MTHHHGVKWIKIVTHLTHWGRVTNIYVGKLTIVGWDNGLSRGQRQAIISTNAGILLIKALRTNFGEILIEIQTFSLKEIRLKMSSAKCCPFRLGLNKLLAVFNWISHYVQMGAHSRFPNTSKPEIVGHYTDVIMSATASQITSVSFVYSIVCSGPDQRKHQSSASLSFVRGIHRWPLTKGQ